MRLLSPGLARFEGVRRIDATSRSSRADRFLATLALAGEVAAETTLFEGVFGFPYDHDLHAGTWRLALHRTKKRLGDLGEVLRDDAGCRLHSDAPLLLPDPRCSVGVEDRILLHVAAGHQSSARAISEALGVSLRSAQQGLEGLVKEGLCTRSRVGNAVEYALEDTTFHEPTQIG